MITCPKCQYLNEDKPSVCNRCGHPLQEEAAAAVEPVNSPEPSSSYDQAGQSASSSKEKWDPYLQKGKVVANDYWSYLVDKWQSPVRNGLAVNLNQRINGMITLAIFVVFFSLFSVAATRSFRGIFGSGGSSGISTFFSSLVHSALLVALTVVMLWVVVKFMMKKEANIMDIMTRYSALTVVPACLTAAAFVLSLLTLQSLAMMLMMFVLFGWLAAVVISIFSYYKDTSVPSVDPMYSLFVVFGAIGIYVWLFGNSIAGAFLRFM